VHEVKRASAVVAYLLTACTAGVGVPTSEGTTTSQPPALTTSTLAPIPPTTVTITATNFAFSPATVTIGAGDTVHWVLGEGSHTTTSGTPAAPDGQWDQIIASPVTITFNQAGQFPFFCRFHPSMQGMVVVP